MTSISIWMAISIGLGMAGTAVATLTALRKRGEIMSALDPYETDTTQEDTDMTFSNTSLVYSILPLTGTTYCVLVSLLILMQEDLTDVQSKVALGSLLAVGLSAFFCNVGRAMFYKEALDGLDEKKEGSLENFGKYMVFLCLPETALIYGLLIGILGLTFSGILGGVPPEFGMDAADRFLQAGVIVGLSSIATIAMGYMFNNTPKIYKDGSVFGIKMVKTIMPHIINLSGLTVAVLLMIFSGMID